MTGTLLVYIGILVGIIVLVGAKDLSIKIIGFLCGLLAVMLGYWLVRRVAATRKAAIKVIIGVFFSLP
jgi:hypothetical protein